MKILTLCIMIFGFINQSCGEKAKATEQATIICSVVYGSNNFERCENTEVICYMNGEGLSCKWK
jgi:hypothetical protein